MSKFYIIVQCIFYTVGLYVFLLIALAIAIGQIKKKEGLIKSCLLIGLAIVVDLFLFGLFLFAQVTLRRGETKFNEYPTPYNFSEKRALNLVSDDVVLNFRPALYKKATAISSYTVNIPSIAPILNIDTSSLAKSYVILQDYSSKYPLYDELNELNIKQFIKCGMSKIDSWSVRERLLFSMILQAVVEGFMLHEDLRVTCMDFERITKRLLDNISEGNSFFTLESTIWQSKAQVEEDIISLFDLAKEPLFGYENKDYLILNKKDDDKDDGIVENPDFYKFLYNDISAKEYIAFLFEKNRPPEHLFVLLKDYHELINSNKIYKQFRGYHNLLSSNLIKVLGVTEPIIRYYSSADFLIRDDILSVFNYNNKSDEDILYLEATNGRIEEPHLSKSESSFSYQILNYNPNVLSLEYQGSQDGYLYFSDCYDTYWNAFIDGKGTDVYKANIAFKAIKIPYGRHKVDFIYSPVYFKISLWFYYLAFGICFVYLSLGALRKKKET